jgi:hypothetical protein
LIVAALRRCAVRICWIDEYNIGEQDMKLYSWLPKGKDEFLYNQARRWPLHVIAAVTDTDLITFVV